MQTLSALFANNENYRLPLSDWDWANFIRSNEQFVTNRFIRSSWKLSVRIDTKYKVKIILLNINFCTLFLVVSLNFATLMRMSIDVR